MSSNITSIQQRVQALRTSYAIKESKRQEDAMAAKRSLDLISEEDISMLSGIVPELSTIVKYSVEDIRENKNGEADMIKSVRAKLMQYVEQRLSYYEEQL